MFRSFSFLPPIGSYTLAVGVLAGTYYAQAEMLADNPDADVNRIWLVGGILAFLLAFGGLQKSMELRGEAMTPRVSSSDVMEKLAHADMSEPRPEPDMPSHMIHEPAEDSPLTRVRARSNPTVSHDESDRRRQPAADTPLGRIRARSKPVEQI